MATLMICFNYSDAVLWRLMVDDLRIFNPRRTRVKMSLHCDVSILLSSGELLYIYIRNINIIVNQKYYKIKYIIIYLF